MATKSHTAASALKAPGAQRGYQRPDREAGRVANLSSIGAEKPPLLANPSNLTGRAGAPSSPNLIIADARKVSGRDFLDALGLSSPEKREARRQQDRERCIRAIERGNTYGFPPSLVAECRTIMELRQPEGSSRIEA